MKKKGGADDPSYATPVPGKNLCKKEGQEDALYFSKVIEYKKEKEEDINSEIESIIVSTNYISKIPNASDYVLYPDLDLSCGLTDKLQDMPYRYDNVAAIFVMEQAIPLTTYIENLKSIQIDIEQTASLFLTQIKEAIGFLNMHAYEGFFHGDPQIYNLVYHKDRVKFIDYNPINRKDIPDSQTEFSLVVPKIIEPLLKTFGLRTKKNIFKTMKPIESYDDLKMVTIDKLIDSSHTMRRMYDEQIPSTSYSTPPRPQAIAFQGYDTPPPKKFTFSPSSYLSPPPKN